MGQVGLNEEPSLCDVGNRNAGSSVGKPLHPSGVHHPGGLGTRKGSNAIPSR